MIVTLSERRLSELIRSLENISDTDSEIAYRMAEYASKLFVHVAEGYGLRMEGMIQHTGDIAEFRFAIGGAKDFHGQIDWDKLVAGLQFMNPLCVSVEREDLAVICDKLIGNQALQSWDEYAPTLQRILPGQLESRIEAALLKYVWNRPIEITAQTPTDKLLAELQIQEEFANAGLVDPSLKTQAVDKHREKEIADYQAAEARRHQEFYNQFTR